VVVQRRDLESVLQCSGERRIHFVLEQHDVAHDHRGLPGLLEGRPRADALERLECPAVDDGVDVAARLRDLGDAVGELDREPGEVSDALCVWYLSRCTDRAQHHRGEG
jgi:hypothetical protein